MKAGETQEPAAEGGLLPSHRGDWGDYPAAEGAGGVTPHGSTAWDNRQPIGAGSAARAEGSDPCVRGRSSRARP